MLYVQVVLPRKLGLIPTVVEKPYKDVPLPGEEYSTRSNGYVKCTKIEMPKIFGKWGLFYHPLAIPRCAENTVTYEWTPVQGKSTVGTVVNPQTGKTDTVTLTTSPIPWFVWDRKGFGQWYKTLTSWLKSDKEHQKSFKAFRATRTWSDLIYGRIF